MLYTAEEIAKKYGGENKNITSYTVTQQWVKKGLKHIRGKGKSYLFKIEWVEEFLEQQANEVAEESNCRKGNTKFKFNKKIYNSRSFVI